MLKCVKNVKNINGIHIGKALKEKSTRGFLKERGGLWAESLLIV